MNDKQDRYFILTVAIALLIYWFSRPKNQAVADTSASAPDGFINDPVLAGYDPASGFQQTPLSNPNITVDVGNQGLSYLNDNYIPLFGFVGVAH